MTENRHRILVGMDLSPSADVALGFAVQLAEEMGAHLVLAYMHQVMVSAVPEKMLVAPDGSEALVEAERRLRELAGRIDKRVPVTVQVRIADPVLGLLQLVDELKPDMIVVGSHGRGAVMRRLLGSVAEKLCRRSPVPVVVVPAPERTAALIEVPDRT